MFKVFLSFSITLSALLIPFSPTNAEPDSCRVSAITTKEKEAVDILQEMYFLQSDMRSKLQSLDELNYQMSQRPNRRDADAVARYNILVREYNKIVEKKNQLSNQHNELKDAYNALLNYISPSRNFAFTSCLNSELLNLQINTTRLNTDSLNTRVNNLRTNLKIFQY